MQNNELIKALRCEKDCKDCSYWQDNAWSHCDEWGMRCDAADAIERLQAQVPRWIPVTERLPELTKQVEGDDFLVDYSKDVLVYVNGDPIFTRNIQVGRYQIDNCGGKGFTDEMFEPIHNVTHWMPLPDAPEVKE